MYIVRLFFDTQAPKITQRYGSIFLHAEKILIQIGFMVSRSIAEISPDGNELKP